MLFLWFIDQRQGDESIEYETYEDLSFAYFLCRVNCY